MRRLTYFALLLIGLMAYGWLIYIPQQVAYGPAYPIARTPTEVSLRYRDVTVTEPVDGISLQGWFIPVETARAAVLFLHGGGSNRHSAYFEALDFYKALATLGYSVFTIDLRNHGNSSSDGEGLSFGLREARDAAAALDWLQEELPGTPIVMMGISMGGATAIHAIANGADPAGLILLDPLLDTDSTFTRGIWTQTGLPPSLFAPSAWSARTFFGFPGGDREARQLALSLQTPTLLIQDPGDPVTIARFAREVAEDNPAITLWEAPAVANDDPRYAWKGRWGSHVAAFAAHPDQTMAIIDSFIRERVLPPAGDIASTKPGIRNAPAR